MTKQDIDETIDQIIKTSPYFRRSATYLEDLIGQDKQELLQAETVRLLRKMNSEEYEVLDTEDDDNETKQPTTRNIAEGETLEKGEKLEIPEYDENKTLYLEADKPTKISVEFTPDGANWYTDPQSPIEFSEAGQTIHLFEWSAMYVRLTADTDAKIIAQLQQ